jgi:hypothetical protein
MPTVSARPGRISDGLTEAINVLIKKILRVETHTLQIPTTTRGIGYPYAKQVVRITREISAQLASLLINYAGTPVSNGFRADTIT